MNKKKSLAEKLLELPYPKPKRVFRIPFTIYYITTVGRFVNDKEKNFLCLVTKQWDSKTMEFYWKLVA